ncbi:hypothetical protein LCGC14_1245740 [marine sediment metagenome]|uniref:Uncharacterized protein n=1 Tax=marine sediment metagenome TaxID=412755 RepID=A0A0F9P8I1_9ZZZZ
MDVDDKVLERLQALLRLAKDGGATEAEASLAMERAHDLLLKHGLEMADVEGDTGNVVGDVEEFLYDGLTRQQWIPSLVSMVADNNYCRVIILHTGQLSIIGRSYNVKVVHQMSLWLIGQLSGLASTDWDAREFLGRTEGVSRTEWRESFIVGVMNRLGERLRMQRAEDEGRAENVRTMVVTFDRENADFLNERYPNLRDGRRYFVHTDAYRAGVSAGSSVSIMPEQRQVRS